MAVPIPFGHFQSEMLSIYRATRAPRTAFKMRQVLAAFAALPGIVTTADMTTRNVAALGESFAAKHPNTRATLLSYFRRACSYASRVGYLDLNPFSAWPGFVRYVPCARKEIHSAESIGRALASLAGAGADFAAARLHAWAAVLAQTGMRRDEGLYLQRDDIDLAAGRISIRRRLKRPSCGRDVPIPAALAVTLREWLPRVDGPHLFPGVRGRGPWHGGAKGYRPAERLRAAGELAGVAGFTPSSLRHSFATLCATRWNVPPAVLQRLMGHTDLKTTMRYYVHLEAADLAAAAESVRFA